MAHQRLFFAAIAAWFALCAFGGVIPVEKVSVPSIAAANGFTTLAMNQDATTGFDIDQAGDGKPHLWHNGSWYIGSAPASAPYGRVPAQYISLNPGGYIDLDWNISMAVGCQGTGAGCPVPTIITAAPDMSSYRGFGHGYYECRAAIVDYSPGAYAACFMLGVTTSLDCVAGGYDGWNTTPSPGPIFSEFDIQQVFGTGGSGATNGANYAALHYSPADTDCGLTTTVQPPSPPRPWLPPDGTDLSQPHDYGLLWCGAEDSGSACNGTPQVCYYFDGTQEYCADTTAADEDQEHLLIAWSLEACNGLGPPDLNNSSCLGSVTDIHNEIYSIRYWSCGAWQSNALAC